MRLLGRLLLTLVIAAFWGGVLGHMASAEAPDRSLRPEARPEAAASPPAVAPTATPRAERVVSGGSALAVASAPRPQSRPRRVERAAARARAQTVARAQQAAAPAREAQASAGSTRRTPSPAPEPTPAPQAPAATQSAAASTARPAERPRGLGALFRRSAQPAYPTRGSVCGNPAIRGVTVAPVQGSIRGCGIAEPVRITEVAGVRLSTSATIDCPTAQALHTWIEQGAKPAVGRRGGGLAALTVAAHYVCRTRNNQRGARISEHGRGRAIDISAVVFENGQRVTVLHGWRSRENGEMMRQMHRAACGPFGTVLGPNSDRFHQDHFHFDTARYRSGPYCR